MSLRAVIPLLLLFTVKQYKCTDQNCIENKKLEGIYKEGFMEKVKSSIQYCTEICENNKNCESFSTDLKFCFLCGYLKNKNHKGECSLVDTTEGYYTCFVRCFLYKYNGSHSSVKSVLIGEKHEINCRPDHYVKGTSKTSVIAKCGYDADKGITQFTFDGEKVECIESKTTEGPGKEHYTVNSNNNNNQFYTQWWFWLIILIFVILITLAITGFFIYRRRKENKKREINDKSLHIEDIDVQSTKTAPSTMENLQQQQFASSNNGGL